MPRTRLPCRQLNSKVVQNSLRANVLTLISDDMKAVSCRAVWRVTPNDVELAKLQIASKRLQLDDVIAKMPGVRFFISAITAVTTTGKHTESRATTSIHQTGTSNQTVVMYPSVAYFIVLSETDQCNENMIFTALHNHETEASVDHIITRPNGAGVMEEASRQLFQVVKDHKNETVSEMVQSSNAYCLSHCALDNQVHAHSVDGDSEIDPRTAQSTEAPRYFPTKSTRLVVVDECAYGYRLQQAFDKLSRDGLVMEISSLPNWDVDTRPPMTAKSELSSTIVAIMEIMKLCDHALYRGDVYAKPEEARLTYVRMMDVDSYLNRLLSNDAIREQVIKHHAALLRILSHHACSVIEQISFDLDVIEVSNGYFFRLSKRRFFSCSADGEKCPRGSPRAFVPYDPTTPPDAGLFEEGILNSFPDVDTRVAFLNKFYQCLMAGRMPHKARKLVVAGPKDSGKTSWASIFHRIVPPHKIASLTNEAQFSAAMINGDTELIIIDEWSEATLSSHLAKTVLQGGWMVTAVKHERARCINNNSPFYMTANNVPNFGQEDENVKRRIVVYQTKSLPRTIAGGDKWIYDNAMACIAWVANEIEEHIELVEEDERWYECNGEEQQYTIDHSTGLELFDSNRIRTITKTDILGEPPQLDFQCNNLVHESFRKESTYRHLVAARAARTFDTNSENSASVDGVLSESQETVTDLDQLNQSLSNAGTLRRTNINTGISSSESDVLEEEGSRKRTLVSMEDGPSKLCRPTSTQQPLTQQDDGSGDNPDDDDDIVFEPPSPAAVAIGQEPSMELPELFPVGDDGNLPHESMQAPNAGETSTVNSEDEYACLSSYGNAEEDSFTDDQINSLHYHTKVYKILKHHFGKDLVGTKNRLLPAHYRSFSARRRTSKTKEKNFSTKADPVIDAWTIVVAELREVFDFQLFYRRYSRIEQEVHSIRRATNVQILPCSDVFTAARKDIRDVNAGTDKKQIHDRNEDVEPADMPEQSYWESVRRWRPW